MRWLLVLWLLGGCEPCDCEGVDRVDPLPSQWSSRLPRRTAGRPGAPLDVASLEGGRLVVRRTDAMWRAVEERYLIGSRTVTSSPRCR